MTKTNILEQEEYTQLFNYIYKHDKVKATKITKDLSHYFEDRRNFSMKLQEMKKKKFITSEGYGKHATYSINEEEVLIYWLINYIPNHGYLLKHINEHKNKDKIINKLIATLFYYIKINNISSQEITLDQINKYAKEKNLPSITQKDTDIEDIKNGIKLNHYSIHDAFIELRDKMLLVGILYFAKKRN